MKAADPGRQFGRRQAMRTTTSKNGTTIAFDRYGDGEPVILVQPAFGHRSFNPQFVELAELLAPSFTVFNYDRRGRGDSGDTAPYAVEREIEDLDALINEAGGSAYVYGISSGAVLALTAANHGLAIRKLALYEPPLAVDDSRPPVPADYIQRLTKLVEDDRRGDAVEYFMTVGVGAPPEMVAFMRTQPMWPSFEEVAHTLPYDAAIVDGLMDGKAVPAGRVAGVTAPSLLIIGTETHAWMRSAANALSEALPKAQVRVIDGEFHAVPPSLLAPAVAEFFDGAA